MKTINQNVLTRYALELTALVIIAGVALYYIHSVRLANEAAEISTVQVDSNTPRMLTAEESAQKQAEIQQIEAQKSVKLSPTQAKQKAAEIQEIMNQKPIQY